MPIRERPCSGNDDSHVDPPPGADHTSRSIYQNTETLETLVGNTTSPDIPETCSSSITVQQSREGKLCSSVESQGSVVTQAVTPRARSLALREPKRTVKQQVKRNNDQEKLKHLCTYCNIRFYTSGHLHKHQSDKHDAEYRYKCPHCPSQESFKSLDGYKKHYRSAHAGHPEWSKENELYPLRTMRRPPKLACACGYCGQFFDLRGWPSQLKIENSSAQTREEITRGYEALDAERKRLLHEMCHKHVVLVHQPYLENLSKEDQQSWELRGWRRQKIAQAFLEQKELHQFWKEKMGSVLIQSDNWEAIADDDWAKLLEQFEFNALLSDAEAEKTIELVAGFLSRSPTMEDLLAEVESSISNVNVGLIAGVEEHAYRSSQPKDTTVQSLNNKPLPKLLDASGSSDHHASAAGDWHSGSPCQNGLESDEPLFPSHFTGAEPQPTSDIDWGYDNDMGHNERTIHADE